MTLAPYGVLVGKTVSVDPLTPGFTIPNDFVGFSYEISYATLNKLKPTNVALVNLFKLFNSKLNLRLGGATSDTQIPINSSIDDAANFVSTVGATLIYGLPGSKIIAPSVTDADQAAVDAAIAVRVSNILGTDNVIYHIGNEPNFAGISYATYAARWSTIQAAVTAAVTNAKFAGSDDGTSQTSRPTFLTQFAPDKGATCALFSMHRYGIPGANDPTITVPRLLANTQALVDARAWKQNPLLSAKPLRMSVGGAMTGGNTLDGPCLGSTLWTLRLMALLAKYGWVGVNFHGTEAATQGYAPLSDKNDGTWNGGQTPWLVNTDIYDGNGTYTPQGTFYAMKLFHALVGGQVLPTGGPPEGLALGVLGADAKTRVLVCNPNLQHRLQVSITSTSAFTAASALILTAPDFVSTDVTLGGARALNSGQFNPSNAPLPVAGGAAILTLNAASSAVVTLT